MLLATESLKFIPDYRFFSVRDYSTVDQSGAAEALAAAHQQIIAASEYEIFVICAQDQLKIDLTVLVHDAPVPNADTAGPYTIPFPTATLHAGDAFGNALTMDLPDDGIYTVMIEHAGREEAARILREAWPQTVDLHGDDLRAVFDQWAGTERYRVTLFPS